MHPDLLAAIVCCVVSLLLLLAGLAGAVWENRESDDAANQRQGRGDVDAGFARKARQA